MFEFLNPRAEEIQDGVFEQALEEDLDFKEAVEILEDQMVFARAGGAGGPAESYSEGENFADAFKQVQRWLDNKKIRVTKDVILVKIATKMDPEGTDGFVDLLSTEFEPAAESASVKKWT